MNDNSNSKHDLDSMPTMKAGATASSDTGARRQELKSPPRPLSEYSFDSMPTMRPEDIRRARQGFSVGETIMDRYVVEGELGRGGMGVVYKCLDKLGKIEVALKALPPELSHDENAMEDIRDNFALVEKLNHPNIANVKQIEHDKTTGTYYLIMELAPGETLRTYMRRKRKERADITAADIIPVLSQVASALDYAHTKKVLHRDVKPENIMIDKDGEVKLLDFGLAYKIRTSLSRVSQVMQGTSGTGPYMSPEQWRAKKQGPASDQYALGVIAYELLSGELPFESSETSVLREAVLNESAEPIESISANEQAAIDKAMSKNAQERYATCGDFIEALSGKMHEEEATKVEAARLAEEAHIVEERRLEEEAHRRTEEARRKAQELEEANVAYEKEMEQIRVVREVEEAQRKAEAEREIKRRQLNGRKEKEAAGAASATTLARWFWVIVIFIGLVCGKYAWSEYNENKSTVTQVEPYSSRARTPSDSKQLTSKTFYVNGVTLEMMPIKAGTFMMGSPTSEQGRYDNETQHRVTLTKDFYIGKYEVTQEQWKAVMGNNPSSFKGDKRPVENVSWNDAQEFIKKLNQMGVAPAGMKFRLPSEAEWEYACRAGTNTRFSFGDSVSTGKMNYSWLVTEWNFYGSTKDVGSYAPNAWGLYDMHGNVYEWCEDWYGGYSGGAETDPKGGPASGDYRVLRGGCWYDYARYCRSASRGGDAPSSRNYYIGFRLVCSAEL